MSHLQHSREIHPLTPVLPLLSNALTHATSAPQPPAGLPKGVLNIVHGTHGTVNRILDHPDIKAVSFVGSNAAGRYIYERGAANGKRVQVGTAFILAEGLHVCARACRVYEHGAANGACRCMRGVRLGGRLRERLMGVFATSRSYFERKMCIKGAGLLLAYT